MTSVTSSQPSCVTAATSARVSSHQIKHMFDWQLTEDAHRLALAFVVNGIAGIAVTKVWGEGRSAAGDGDAVVLVMAFGSRCWGVGAAGFSGVRGERRGATPRPPH